MGVLYYLVDDARREALYCAKNYRVTFLRSQEVEWPAPQLAVRPESLQALVDEMIATLDEEDDPSMPPYLRDFARAVWAFGERAGWAGLRVLDDCHDECDPAISGDEGERYAEWEVDDFLLATAEALPAVEIRAPRPRHVIAPTPAPAHAAEAVVFAGPSLTTWLGWAPPRGHA